MSSSDRMQSVKVVLILCSCFFAFGSLWSDWAFDYYFLWTSIADHPHAVEAATLYYKQHLNSPDLIKYVPFVNLLIAAFGFAAGLANMTDGNILFDGASLVLMLFALSTFASTVRPAMQSLEESDISSKLIDNLKNIAAAHFMMVLAISGIILLQVTHFIVSKRSEKTVVKAKHTPKTEAKKSQ
ncbi:ER membrane protein SH3 [Pilobolus umbonatus]|nr:ER membrane protein SH3 [Pilobolus umbonatus]